MQGTCIKCGTENMDVNPYEDSPYYKMCFVCQIKAMGKEREAKA